ncbi:MAG: Ig-like domain-containing protein, partial [Terriglobales bacterium]
VVCSNVGATYTMIAGSGTCTVTASQAADNDYATASNSESVSATNAQASVSVGTSGSPSIYGGSVTFTATITSDTGAVKGRNGAARNNGRKPATVTGTVAWSPNTGCGTTNVASGYPGTATCTTSILGGGTDTVTATYTSGDANHNTATGSVSQTVSPAANTVTFTTPAPASAEYGSSFTVAASGLGTGAITYTSDGVVCTNVGATYTMIAGSGTCTVTASQAADNNYATASASEYVSATNAQASVSVGSSLSPSIYGQSITFTATITSDTGLFRGRSGARRNGAKPMDITGTVTWNPETGCSASTVSGYPGVATCTTSILAVGTDTVTANYSSGDSNHNSGTGSFSQVVNASNGNVSVTTSGSPSIYGQSVTFTASISGDYGLRKGRSSAKPMDVTGSVTWSDSNGALTCTESGTSTTTVTSGNPGTTTCTTSNLAVNPSDTITGNYSGDANHNAGSGTVIQTINASTVSSTTTVGSTLNPSTYGQAVSFTANVSEQLNAGLRKRTPAGKATSAQPTPTGTVQFNVDGSAFGSPVTLASGSAASGSTSTLTAGTHTVAAAYSGDANYLPSTGTLSGGQVVNPASQTITCGALPASEPYNGSFTASCTASSNLAVAYSSGGSCSNVGATYTMTSGTGSCLVTATQAGNSNYSGATPFNGAVTATPASQTITCNPPTVAVVNSSFTLACNTTSGLPVAYASSGDCSNAGATYTTGKTAGVCMVMVNAAGNSDYAAAPPFNDAISVVKATAPTVTFTGAPASAPYQSTFTVASTTNSGATPAITAAPATVCTISGTTVTMVNGTGTCTMTAKWPANGAYLAATKTQKTTASKLASVITWASPSPITYGTTLSGVLDATANVAGKFAYKANGTAVTATKVLAAGSYTLTATFTPTASTDYATSTATVTLVVNQAATTTTITTTSPNPSAVNKAVKVSFTVAPGKPTGSVTVTASTGETCSGNLVNGASYCNITFMTSGTRTLTASYPGDANNEASASAGFTQTVN